MNIYVSGGCKNGKSSAAEDMAVKLSEEGKLYYVATMIPYDDEDRARIRKHIENRAGKGFQTIECGLNVEECLKTGGRGTYLVDSVTALLLNEMFPASHNYEADPDAHIRTAKGLRKLAEGAENVVFVSDYLYSDAKKYDEFTENYRRSLAYVDREVVKVCDAVVEYCAGNASVRRGEEALREKGL